MSTLKLIEEIDEIQREAPPAPAPDKASSVPVDLLLLALKALSQRTLVALAALQTLLAIGSVLFLAYSVLSKPAPSIIQVTGVAIYAAFVLVALWLSNRRR